jgi:hypothetical protein
MEQIEHRDLQESRRYLAEKMSRIIADIRLIADGDPTYISRPHLRVGGAALNITNVLNKFAVAYTKFDTELSMTEIKGAINELQRQINDFFNKNETTNAMLFNDTFKGLWNAGKMIGKGMMTSEAVSEKILYKNKKTVLSEVLDNINFSQYSLGKANYTNIEETDFSGMSIEDIADTLTDIMAENALPQQCEMFREELASFIFDNAQYVGTLEQIIKLRQHQDKLKN